MDSVDMLALFQMFAGLSPDELRLVAGTAQEVELMSTFVTPDDYRRFASTRKAVSVPPTRVSRTIWCVEGSSCLRASKTALGGVADPGLCADDRTETRNASSWLFFAS
jgi:hypothetical protein